MRLPLANPPNHLLITCVATKEAFTGSGSALKNKSSSVFFFVLFFAPVGSLQGFKAQVLSSPEAPNSDELRTRNRGGSVRLNQRKPFCQFKAFSFQLSATFLGCLQKSSVLNAEARRIHHHQIRRFTSHIHK